MKSFPNCLSVWFGIFSLISRSSCQYFTEQNTCASFHLLPNFQGESFHLEDGSEATNINLDDDIFPAGWNTTGSIKVENGCELKYCSEAYFNGNCQTIEEERPGFSDSISSLRCECANECKCENVYMKKSSCARAYLKGGCRTCNNLYFEMKGAESFVNLDQVEAFRLRKGCNLTLYSEKDFGGNKSLIVDEIYEDYNGQFKSYDCQCDDSQFEERAKPPRPANYPTMMNIPDSLDNFVGSLSVLNLSSVSSHPGIRAALDSAKNKRSGKNAYVLLLGSSGSGKSSAMRLLFDHTNMTRVSRDMNYAPEDIQEFRIPVPIDELGISNSELRIIDTPGFGNSLGLQQDAKFLSTLDHYLSSHDELSNSLPNVVLIFHKFTDNRFSNEDSNFIRMVRALDYFRGRIVDENYPNVIFVLSHFCSETKSNQLNPDRKLRQFKKVIEEFTSFPKPIIFTLAENKGKDQELPMADSSYKLPNGEYYPKNLIKNMERVTTKGGDPIGLNVLRSAFKDSSSFNISYQNFHAGEDTLKIKFYLQVLSNPGISPNQFQSEYITNMEKKCTSALTETNEAFNKEFLRMATFYEKRASNSEDQEGLEQSPSIILEPVEGLDLPSHIAQISSYGRCINVRFPNVPTRLVYLGNKLYQSRYEIKGYNEENCDDTSGLTRTFHFDEEINKRVPICSFQLNSMPQSNLTVAFFGEDLPSPSYRVNLLGNTCQRSVCSYPQVAYASSVNITVNGRSVDESIKLFKDNNCQEEIQPGTNVRHGEDLANLTRNNIEIKSLRVVRK